jgi:hypothetical protein
VTRSVSTERRRISALPRFHIRDADALLSFFREYGFALVHGLYDERALAALDVDMAAQQAALLAGELPERCGTVILDSPDAAIEGAAFAHYVCHISEVSELAYAAVWHPALVDLMHAELGDGAWLLDDDRFGVVFQDARPGPASAYSRIGWHSDEQSGPHLPIWPSVAFTIHLDATSPANGFLRVLPGSHFGDAANMPPGFERVPGEIAVYADRGDVIVHHSALWHSAARATDDGPAGIRRHLRGGWYGGQRLAPGHGVDDFVKNAQR